MTLKQNTAKIPESKRKPHTHIKRKTMLPEMTRKMSKSASQKATQTMTQRTMPTGIHTEQQEAEGTTQLR
jgi:hypothetical protein